MFKVFYCKSLQLSAKANTSASREKTLPMHVLQKVTSSTLLFHQSASRSARGSPNAPLLLCTILIHQSSSRSLRGFPNAPLLLMIRDGYDWFYVVLTRVILGDMQVLNILLRLAWVQTVLGFREAPFLHRTALTAVVASLEIIRRGIWNFFRYAHYNMSSSIIKLDSHTQNKVKQLRLFRSS